jgi:hypothetical protein
MSEQIPRLIATKLQLAMIAGNEPRSSFLELRLFEGDRARCEWFPVAEYAAAAQRATELAPTMDVYVGAAPRVRRSGTKDDVERVWSLWVDADTPQAVEALRAFRPLPSVVIRSGTPDHLHAWWPLSAPLPPDWAARCNRRLALALGADRASTDAARIMRPAASWNHKQRPPARAECVRLECDAFTAADVVRGLPDDPAYQQRPAPERRVPPAGDGGRVLAGLARVVRDAIPDTRNTKLNWAAYRAGEHVHAGALDISEVESELLAAALDAGLPEREAARTIASGLTAAERRAA